VARLFPALNLDEIENPGERSVAQALVEQLPNRVEIFHSFNWLVRDRRGTIQEGESDFVLVDPENGILFVEVKGGSLLFDGREWVREVRGEHRSLNKDPFGQAVWRKGLLVGWADCAARGLCRAGTRRRNGAAREPGVVLRRDLSEAGRLALNSWYLSVRSAKSLQTWRWIPLSSRTFVSAESEIFGMRGYRMATMLESPPTRRRTPPGPVPGGVLSFEIRD
jgi:hypothetical protein